MPSRSGVSSPVYALPSQIVTAASPPTVLLQEPPPSTVILQRTLPTDVFVQGTSLNAAPGPSTVYLRESPSAYTVSPSAYTVVNNAAPPQRTIVVSEPTVASSSNDDTAVIVQTVDLNSLLKQLCGPNGCPSFMRPNSASSQQQNAAKQGC